jgi:tetratricopeptide (TPR) repeat protein
LNDAAALLREGCFDCLADAFRIYDSLRSVPSFEEAATAGAVRASALLSLRERELGTEDSGYLPRARALAAGLPAVQASMAPLLEIAEAVPWYAAGASRRITDDGELTRMQFGYRRRDEWLGVLGARADEGALSAHLWLAFNCVYSTPTSQAIGEWLDRVPAWRGAPLVAFKTATCGSFDDAALERLLAADPRFVEAHYFVGLRSILRGRLDEAAEHLEQAYAWRPRWPAVTNSLGNVYLTAEEFEKAAASYARTLAVVPRNPDALLGTVRALTYVGRYTEALDAVDRLLALEHWYIGDARYWRALIEAQLRRNEDAWTDVELAAKLLVNAEVPKLAGIVAYRLQHPAVAQAKFEESLNRDSTDCETAFYLGVVLADERLWPRSAEVLIGAAGCLEHAREAAQEEIVAIRASADPPERKAKQIARREQKIAEAGRMLVTSWFNTAVAYYSLDQKPEARTFAQKVIDDDQFGARARELLSRLR